MGLAVSLVTILVVLIGLRLFIRELEAQNQPQTGGKQSL